MKRVVTNTVSTPRPLAGLKGRGGFLKVPMSPLGILIPAPYADGAHSTGSTAGDRTGGTGR